jgi:Tfp pilus assembly protein PilZ
MFIETREPLSIGQYVTLTFKLPNSVEHIKVNGEIVRVSSKGLGVKFRKKLDDSV